MQNVKEENEDLISYAARVNRHCEIFLLSKCTADNLKCLLFVNGLKCKNDQEYKVRLLQLLDSESEQNPLTLDNLVAEIERINSLKNDIATKESNQPKVNAVDNFIQKGNSKVIKLIKCQDDHAGNVET